MYLVSRYYMGWGWLSINYIMFIENYEMNIFFWLFLWILLIENINNEM